MTPVEALCAAMSELPGVTVAWSRFGSFRLPPRVPARLSPQGASALGRPSTAHANLAWRIDGREFAHLHSESLLDLRLPRADQARLRTDPRAHFRKSRSEWLELEFHTSRDVVDLLTLAQEAAGLPTRRDSATT